MAWLNGLGLTGVGSECAMLWRDVVLDIIV
jgi:hypothetical protein